MTSASSPAQRSRSSPRWLLALAPLVGLAASCGGSDEALDPAYLGEPGPRGYGAAARCTSGATRTCYVTLGVHETEAGQQILTCYEGTQSCVDEIWGECTDGEVSEIPAPDPDDSQSASGSSDIQAYSDPTGCENNPCDPFCREYQEVPPLPLEPDPDVDSWEFTWPHGSLTALPPGLRTKALVEPCTGGWDCQFNTHCFAPGDGDCVHGVCQAGAALTADCDMGNANNGNGNNGSCVAAICAVDPTCCGAAPVQPECADGEIVGPSGDKCYVYESTAARWSVARDACRAHGDGWDLVAIESGSENLFVHSLQSARAWIGANDQDTEGTFVWADGSELSYTSWNGGEPNDWNTGEDCTEMRTDGLWNDMPCTSQFAYVCEGPSVTGNTCAHDPCQRGAALKASCNTCVAQICASRPSCCNSASGAWDEACVEEVSSSCGNSCECPAGQASFGGSCYSLGTNKKWDQAKNACQADAGWDLVSIGSAEENAFILETFVTADTWIGFTDATTEGTWVWTNGEPAGSWVNGSGGSIYTNWDSGEPNEGTSGNCGRIMPTGRWRDYNSNNLFNYVCEGPGSTMVVGEVNLPEGGTWTQDCVDLVDDACVADCNPSDPGDVSGHCIPWYAGETDPDCAGIDLSLDVPCQLGTNQDPIPVLPVCNHGNTTAPAGIMLVHYPGNSDHYPHCDPDLDDDPGVCWTDQPIPPGYCIEFSDCPGITQGNEREYMINPLGPNHIDECNCEDNWSLYDQQACRPPICDGGLASATPIRTPVDIVFIIDNSPSMDDDIEQVQARIHEDFAAIIAASGLDYRVIMVSRYGDVDVPVNPSSCPICIGEPLGQPCTDPANDPLQNNPPNFFHYSANIGSWDSWCKLLEGFDTSDELDGGGRTWTPVAPNGWGAWLREDAFKTFVVITDDDVSCNKYGYNFNDGSGVDDVWSNGIGTVAGGEAAAAAFDAALLALSPAQFGTSAVRRYVWHSIVNLDWNDPVDAPWEPTDDIQVDRCSYAWPTGPGTGYQALSVLTGGLRYPICNNANFDAIFNAIAENVIETSEMICEFDINSTVPIEPSSTEVLWQHADEDEEDTTLTRVRDAASCAANGWYFDDPTNPTILRLCEDTCNAVGDEPGSQIVMEIGCAVPADDTDFYQTYFAECPIEGAPQWGYLAWDTTLPDDGTQIIWRVRTAATEEELATAAWSNPVATTTYSNQVCSLTDCPGDVFNTLPSPDNRYPYLELWIRIEPGDSPTSPLVNSWELTFSCPPDE